MPTEMTVHVALIWFALGFVVSLGWTLAAWLLGRALKWVP